MGRRNKGQPVHGWINLDKPQGLTSTQALARVRRILDANKGGHAGTLDPLATGILPIALGEATKIIPFVQDREKTYSFTVQWGAATDTEDSEGQITATSAVRPDISNILGVLSHFIGEIEQVPPRYSAIKIDGQRAYDLARAGEDIEMKSRIIRIDHLELIEARENEAVFRVDCGKGTYVRSLARDIALKLGTLGHITALRREKVGGFNLQNTISLDLLEKMEHSAALEKVLQPIQTPLDDIPALDLSDQEVARLKNGQSLSFISRADVERLPALEHKTVLTMQGNKAIALTERKGAELKPVRVFNL